MNLQVKANDESSGRRVKLLARGRFKHGLVGPQLLEVRTPDPELRARAHRRANTERRMGSV
jgi:hypothetical protein